MGRVGELEEAAADTPVYVVVAYSEALLNRAGVAALGLTPATRPPQGGSFEFVDGGAIFRQPPAVYAGIAGLPLLSPEDKLNSTQHFLRELSRFGLTSAIDAGATGTPYPGDYRAVETLSGRPKFPTHVSNLLFPQHPGTHRVVYEKLTGYKQRNARRAQ